jgi:hypothetical protein
MSYDYFIKDHLGNVRMMLTEEKDTSFYPTATVEEGMVEDESIYYAGLDNSVERIPETYPFDTHHNVYGALVSGDMPYLGPSIVLKVMAGDQFNLRVESGYISGTTPTTHEDPLEHILTI